jgi:hypothetical protein
MNRFNTEFEFGLNEKEYSLLCKACDSVLMDQHSTIECTSIPWLHIIREHPVFFESYLDLFSDKKTFNVLFKKKLRAFKNRVRFLRNLWSGLSLSFRYRRVTEIHPKNIDYLFISHILNDSQLGQDEDFYFGNVPNTIASKTHSSLVCLIDHTGKLEPSLSQRWGSADVPRVILSGSLRLLEEISLFLRVKRESYRLKRMIKRESHELNRRVISRAAEEVYSSGTRQALIIASQIEKIVKKTNPKAIFVTYEGYAWERVVFSVARKVYPEIQCFGYQHAAIFNKQHALRRNLRYEYNPDMILTSGMISKVQLEDSLDLDGIKIEVLGSNRLLKNEVKIKDVTQVKNTCVVLPEGIEQECNLLFKFALECAKTMPEIKFIFRLHPIISFDSLLAKNSNLRNLPKNIILSDREIEDDLLDSSWAIYRGSTAIVQAVCGGIRPLYFKLQNEMTIDPLYMLDSWRVGINNSTDFKNIVDKDRDKPFNTLLKEKNYAQLYCSDFYMPFNYKVITDCFSGNISER